MTLRENDLCLAQSTDGAHYEPLFTLWESLVRIDGRTGESLMSPAKQISREEALRMYTINGARVVFMEDQLGSIEPGKLADLVVLDRNILTCPVDEIKDAKVSSPWLAVKPSTRRRPRPFDRLAVADLPPTVPRS